MSRSCQDSESESGSVILGSGGFRGDKSVVGNDQRETWGSLPLDLLRDIIQRVEASGSKGPENRILVSCGCVCRHWRLAALKVAIRAHFAHPGRIAHPCALKKPGPRDHPVRCIMRRNKKNGSFFLYLPVAYCKVKFLLAAQGYRNGPRVEYVISLDPGGPSPGAKTYVGKLRSDFRGTNFVICDRQPPHSGAKPSSSGSARCFANNQISPQVSGGGDFEVGTVSYEFNILNSKGPRRMVCSIKPPPSDDEPEKKKNRGFSSHRYTVLKNKVSRWHDDLHCWRLNFHFHGRVTMASVKNFQLIEDTDPRQLTGWKGDETVLLHFGEVCDDTFIMDYRHPLSAFQAFAICLTSFGPKLVFE